MNVWLICIGLLVHTIFFASIFDIYFTSPLVHGMTPHSTKLPPPAKRLVLFVADGLRADKFFQLEPDGRSRAPYLRNVIEKQGSWGVSHTRVPSESRPGHVALIAGFYEDVSAVAKGWKENPVEFDSVFNESRYTWSWGSPDILPMFAKGATGEHVFTHTYPPHMEDFADADASKLDTWVFDQVKKFVADVKTNPSLKKKISSNKIVLFLHLLGIDTNGHSHKPYSEEYMKNIALVDSGMREMVDLVEGLFEHDGKTAYVMTADHGMTNWGSHGAGHPSETLTPLVAWGAGINGPTPGNEHKFADGFTQDWQLTGLKRSDVSQADIASLMASLIGIPFPLNSVGVLPLDYLNNTDKYKAEALLTNAQQILASYQVKEDHMRETTLGVFFTPFNALADGRKADLYRKIRQLIAQEKYEESIALSDELIQATLDGLNYYQTYDRFFLETSIALGYLGWMAYILQILFSHHTSLVKPTTKMGSVTNHSLALIFVAIAMSIVILLTIQSSPLVYYVYCLLPVPLWYAALKRYNVFHKVSSYITGNLGIVTFCFYCILGVVAIEMLVMIMFRREVISFGLLAMSIWPLCTHLRKTNKILVCGWFTACLVLAIFPMMPVVGRDVNINQVTLAGCLALLSSIAALYTCYTQTSPKPRPLQTAISICQVALIALAIYIVNSTWTSLDSKEGVPMMNKVMSWTMLVLCFVLPALGPRNMLLRLLSTEMSLMGVYLLMSTAHEGLFCIALCYLMLLWLLCEHQLSTSASQKIHLLSFGDNTSLDQGPPRKLQLDDIRCAHFFVFFTITAFFGTGNIASINSFEPASVYCFLTVFDPFIMGGLLLWKIVILFLLVTCTFQAIHLIQRLPTSSLFLIVLLLSDIMALHFFFFVQDHGSWLEIGTSISHYVIVMCMIIFVTMLLVVARLFTTITLPIITNTKPHKQ